MCYAVNIFKNKPLKNFKRGRAPGAPALGPPLKIMYVGSTVLEYYFRLPDA